MPLPLLLSLHLLPIPALQPPALALAPVAPFHRLELLSAPSPDPHARSFVGTEVLAGDVGVLGASVVAVGTGLIVMGVIDALNPGRSGPGDYLYGAPAGAVTWLVLELVLPPLGASLGASLANRPPRAGSLGTSLLYGYLASLAGAGVSTGLYFLAGSDGAGFAVGPLFMLLVQFIAVPIAASFGLHDGPDPAAASTQWLDAPAPAHLVEGNPRGIHVTAFSLRF